MSLPRIAVIHGPNLNLLGSRETSIYGVHSIDEIDQSIRRESARLGMEVSIFQSNSEGRIVDAIQDAGRNSDAIIINPAAYTHTSIAIRDALIACNLPVFEVHISNIYRREPFRHRSLISDIASGCIIGCSTFGYILAVHAAHNLITKKGSLP